MPRTETRTIDVHGQLLKVGVRRGKGVPLLIFNGIGANMELLEPLTRALQGIETIVFDLPGTGGSAVRRSPYRLSGFARLAERLLQKLGYSAPVDVLGISWGGALAQQFAYGYPQRCRRLVLAASTPGVLMVPGSPFLLAKLFVPRRYSDPKYLHKIAPNLYGGELRSDPTIIEEYLAKIKRPHWLGYFYQQLAFCSWSSLLWLTRLRQPTLVLGGRDDPLAPLANARILAWLIPRAKLHIVNDGHLFLMTGSLSAAPLIRQFLLATGHP